MNKREHELIEQELQKLRPAKPPEEFMARMQASVPVQEPRRERVHSRREISEAWWLPLLRWMAPVGSVALILALGVWQFPLTAQAHAIQADSVELDHQLVSSFDAVGELPTGEPVRFRCRRWNDSVVFRDTARGLSVERTVPRLEVFPVAFETY